MKKFFLFFLIPMVGLGQKIENPEPIKEINSGKSVYFPFVNEKSGTIFYTERINGIEHLVEFKQSKILILNNFYNEGTAILANNGKKLIYSACNEEKNFGSCDIVERNLINNHWSEPKNLGMNINSKDWEGHPFLSKDEKTLIFSSEKYGGNGKKDLWISKKNELGEWEEAKPMNSKINSAFQELGPFLWESKNQLIFSSDRPGGRGKLDYYIYDFNLDSLWNFTELNSPLDEAGIYISSNNQEIYFSKDIKKNQQTITEIWKAKFIEEKKDERKEIPIEFKFLNINFAINSYELPGEMPQNSWELVEFLKINSSVRILITGHTDASGTEKNNLILSVNRSLALKNWLINQGIASSRLLTEGKGNSQPISENSAANRRIEVEIIP